MRGGDHEAVRAGVADGVDLAKEEGLLLGISAGANVWASIEVAKQLEPGQNVVTILCDTGERYFSLGAYFQ